MSPHVVFKSKLWLPSLRRWPTNATLASATSFPNDEALRLTVEFLTGADAAKTMTINWLRMVHLRG